MRSYLRVGKVGDGIAFRSLNLLSSAITAFRYFSSKTSAKSTKWTRYKSKNQMNHPKKPKMPQIKWTEQQSQIMEAVCCGQSVFITGSAGTGKTILLREIIRRLQNIKGRSSVFVTAATGVAACALRGQTLHSFAGVGLGDGDRDTLVGRVSRDKKAYRRWNRARVLVIDEISMVDAEYFDKLQYIAQMVRDGNGDSDPKFAYWGGIQIVVSGDFLQLPPIVMAKKSRGKEFAFEADCWGSSFDMQVELTNVFRQSDTRLVKLLRNIRRGQSDPEDLQLLQKCSSETEPDASFVQIYPLRKDVDRVNKKKMDELDRFPNVYRAVDHGEDPWKKQLKRGIAPDELVLCEGARVMLAKNLNPWRKLNNGATGTVMGFCEPESDDDVDCMDICELGVLPLVKLDSGQQLIIYPETWEVREGNKVVAVRKQLPLILAWALSIHKCQGMTLDRLHTDLSAAFDFGMVYVALSRVKSLDGLHLSGFDPLKIKAHPKAIQFYQGLSGLQDEQREEDGVNKDKISSISSHPSNKTIHAEMDMNHSSLIDHCKPNSSLISWYNNVTQRRLG